MLWEQLTTDRQTSGTILTAWSRLYTFRSYFFLVILEFSEPVQEGVAFCSSRRLQLLCNISMAELNSCRVTNDVDLRMEEILEPRS